MIDFFFRAHRTNDLTKKLEKVGPFECDELEKHCRVSAKCYPTKVPALYTMAKEEFNSLLLVLLLALILYACRAESARASPARDIPRYVRSQHRFTKK